MRQGAEWPIMLMYDGWRWSQGTSPAAELYSQSDLTVAVLAHICTVHMNILQLTGLNASFIHRCLLRGIEHRTYHQHK